jgi:two-component system, OmpR family, heavy metal sensor histidine kinase CusS
LKTAGERLGRTSIGARLALGFIAVAVTLLAGIGLYLDHALEEQLAADDARELASKLPLLRKNLERTRSLEELRAKPHRFMDAVVGNENLSLSLREVDGRVIASAGAGADAVLKLAGAPEAMPGDRAERTLVAASEGRLLRVLTRWSRLGDAAETPVNIVLALDVTHRADIVRKYRERIVFAVAVAALAAGLLGAFVARTGLAPLRSLARRAGAISASRLDERLPAEGVPAELRELAGAFNRTLQRLEDSFRRLSQFSADLAHDLRTPIGNLLGEAQVALNRPRTAADYEAVIASSVEELERINRMIEGMLFLARSDDVQASLDLRPVNAGAEVDRLIDYYEGLAAEAGVGIRRVGDLTLRADASLFRRAIANLVSNAITHSPPGSEITVALGPAPDGGCEVAVSNPGPGIPPQLLPRVFDRFSRADASRPGSEKGSGLGLAIVKSIVELHGGGIEAQSEPGALTTFRMLFPRRPITET